MTLEERATAVKGSCSQPGEGAADRGHGREERFVGRRAGAGKRVGRGGGELVWGYAGLKVLPHPRGDVPLAVGFVTLELGKQLGLGM